MSKEIKAAFQRVKTDIEDLRDEVTDLKTEQQRLLARIEDLREQLDPLERIEEQAQRIADLQKQLDEYNSEQ